MLPCGRTDEQTNKQTSENRATQSLDSVRLSFAIFLKKKTCHSQTGGRGGGSPTWEKFPHFPVFFLADVPNCP